jgi:hypothetical protein
VIFHGKKMNVKRRNETAQGFSTVQIKKVSSF